MKSCILSILLVCSIAAHSQRIKVSETDSVTNTRRIVTTAYQVNKNLADGVSIAFRSEDTALFVQLSVITSANTLVAKNNALVFQLEDGSIVIAKSKGMQVHTSDFKTPIEYRIALQDVKALHHKAIKSISYYTAGGQYKSIAVQQAAKNDLQQVCNVFLNEYQSEPSINNRTATLVISK